MGEPTSRPPTSTDSRYRLLEGDKESPYSLLGYSLKLRPLPEPVPESDKPETSPSFQPMKAEVAYWECKFTSSVRNLARWDQVDHQHVIRRTSQNIEEAVAMTRELTKTELTKLEHPGHITGYSTVYKSECTIATAMGDPKNAARISEAIRRDQFPHLGSPDSQGRKSPTDEDRRMAIEILMATAALILGASLEPKGLPQHGTPPPQPPPSLRPPQNLPVDLQIY